LAEREQVIHDRHQSQGCAGGSSTIDINDALAVPALLTSTMQWRKMIKDALAVRN
jgi:hypothetical protein